MCVHVVTVSLEVLLLLLGLHLVVSIAEVTECKHHDHQKEVEEVAPHTAARGGDGDASVGVVGGNEARIASKVWHGGYMLLLLLLPRGGGA